MTTTPNLDLQELANGQSNFPNANETFAIIDALLQTPIISKDLTAAPGSPAEGATYIMASAWAGVAGAAAGAIALYRAGFGGWYVITPREGWKFEVLADEITYRYDGADWVEWSAGGAGGWDVRLTPSSVSGVLTLDLSAPAAFDVVLHENITSILFTNHPTGTVPAFMVKFRQDVTGGWTITYPGTVVGTPPVIGSSPGDEVLVSFVGFDGTNYYVPV